MSGHLEIEDRGAVLIVRVDGGQHSLFGLDIANELEELVDRVDARPKRACRRVHRGASRPVRQPC